MNATTVLILISVMGGDGGWGLFQSDNLASVTPAMVKIEAPPIVPPPVPKPKQDAPAVPIKCTMWTATWCTPCKTLKPMLEALYYEGWNVVINDYDEYPEIAATWEITTLPTLILHQGGKELKRFSGVPSGTDKIRDWFASWGVAKSAARQRPKTTAASKARTMTLPVETYAPATTVYQSPAQVYYESPGEVYYEYAPSYGSAGGCSSGGYSGGGYSSGRVPFGGASMGGCGPGGCGPGGCSTGRGR